MDSNTTQYWRSLGELQQTPTFQENAGKDLPEFHPEDFSGVSRRRFMQLTGASMALAGVSSCRWENEKILPFASRPANRIPGKAVHFASSLERGGYGVGVSVTSYDGRPIKVEGNKNDGISGGATDVFAQASILELYDPDRSRVVTKDGAESTWDAWDLFFTGAMDATGKRSNGFVDGLRAANGLGVAFLVEATSSPSVALIREQLTGNFKDAEWFEYESVSRDNEIAGAKLALGRALRPQYDASKADVIVSFDSDFFSAHPAQIKHNRDWATKRRPVNGHMGRLYEAGSRFGIEGGMSDHRAPMRSFDVAGFIALVENRLASEGYQLDTAATGASTPSDTASELAAAIAKDLVANRGKSILVAGPNQPAEVHARLHLLNNMLGNFGSTITFTDEPAAARPSHQEALASMVASAKAGKISTLIIIEGNEAYDAPADIDVVGAIDAIKTTVRLGLYNNETSALCDWHLPRTHAFEAWGDSIAYDGTYLISQPTIAPIWGARSVIELLASCQSSEPPSPEMILQAAFAGGDEVNTQDWRSAVHDGVAAAKALKSATPKISPAGEFSPSGASAGIEVTFAPDSKIWDGRHANSAWLQELPDFMTKLTWDNVALMNVATAEKLGLRTEAEAKGGHAIADMVTITVGGNSVTVPVYLMPGQAADSIALNLGYGRTNAGQVGGIQGDEDAPVVGFDVTPLRASGASDMVAATVVMASEKHELAMTQEHHIVDDIGMRGTEERLSALVRESNLSDLHEDDKDHFRHVVHHPPLLSLWTERSHDGHAWGMTLDLSVCNGCNACVIACQSENNIPTVGKSEVIMSREMHWMRIDRYFSGDLDNPKLVTQQVNCQQCENAPCEQVCPVAATTHTEEGLNDMVYNRCVGTRYCANNCAYKVRRFNYKNFHKNLEDENNEVAKLALNPEVTVRVRGVMEKCTYCVQRIQEVKIDAKNAVRPIRDGEIVPACGQVCPTSAIVFGDLADPDSQVSKGRASARAYEMLAELNNKPRNSYLAKIRNPHPDLMHAALAADGASASENGGH